MELKRLFRIAYHRRFTLLALAVVGVAVAAGMTAFRNSNIEPSFRAEAPATFAKEAESLDETILTAQLANALVLARSANQDLIIQTGGRAGVTTDVEPGRILLVAAAGTAEEAQALAQEMRDNYVQMEPLSLSQQIDTQIDDVLTQLDSLRLELQTLATPSLEEIKRQSRITRLGFVVSLLQQNAAELETELLFPTEVTDTLSVTQSLEQVNTRLADFELELAQLEAQPATFTELETQRRAVERRYADLEATYQELFIQREQLGSPARLDVINVLNQTPPAGSLLSNGGLGLFLALLVGTGVLLMVDRIRRPIWLAKDVTILPVLAEVPDRTPQATGIWYEHAAEHPRRRAIQAVRVGVEGRLRGRDRSIVFGAIDVDPESTHALAADFAVSLASAGRRVCLIDADFGAPSLAPEFAGRGPSLAQILTWDAATGLAELKGRIARSLDETADVRSGLVSIRAGIPAADPSDLMAGDALPALISEAEVRFDVVVVASGDLRDPVTQTLCQRIGRTVVTVAPGKTSSATLEAVVEDLAAQQIGFLGAVILGERRLWGAARAVAPSLAPISIPQSSDRSSQVPDRKRKDAEGGAKAKSRSSISSDKTLETTQSSNGKDEVQVNESMSVLPPALADRVYEWAIDVAMGDARPQGIARSWSDTSPSAVGIMHLVRVSDASTAGELILRAMEESLDEKTLQWALGQLEEASTSQRRSSWIDALNDWLASEFFARHVEETGREPEVWHLASRDRTYEGLVHWKRLDADRVDNLREGVVPAMIKSLGKSLQRARRSSLEQSEIIEGQIQDLRLFDLALGWLYEGSVADARIWYPWKSAGAQPRGWEPDPSQGVGPVLAPLQRLGLIPYRVLHSHEVAGYLATEGGV